MEDPAGPGPRSAHHVQSLDRGLAVIRAFGAGHRELTLTEVSRRTDLTRAAARRFLLTLADLGYVRVDGRHFSLTARVLELGFAYLSGQSLPEIAVPHLERLAADSGESSSVSVLDGADIRYVARVPVRRIVTAAIGVGTRLPAHATSMGQVLLAGLRPGELDRYFAGARLAAYTPRTHTSPERLRAELTRIRTRGWALADQELEEGLRSLAVPVRGADGDVVAAVNLSTHVGRTSTDAAEHDLLPPLRIAASRIERDLAATTAGPHHG